MIIYSDTKANFLKQIHEDTLIDILNEKYFDILGKSSPSQINSWKNSMHYMGYVVDDKEIPDDCSISIEYKIPTSNKRIDFIISGKNANNELSAVIVELKQWEYARAVKGKNDILVETWLGGHERETVHPCYQAYSYAFTINNFLSLDKKVELSPCAYLHNYVRDKSYDSLTDQIYFKYVSKAPVFTHGEGKQLTNLIKKHIKFGDSKETLFVIEHGKIKPSKSLQDALSNILDGIEEFMMIDEQKVVYEQALLLAKNMETTNRKKVLIVKGGPGTGKSVVAMNLLAKLNSVGYASLYITKNSAPRKVYAKLLRSKYKITIIENLLKGPDGFWDEKPNSYGVSIVDEAHRLTLKSGMFKNKGNNQIAEIIKASKLPIFFIDNNQLVTTADNGSVAEIKQCAQELNCDVIENELPSQFRCNGSDGYLQWLDNTLQITNNEFNTFSDYEFKVFDDMLEMQKAIESKNSNNKARLVAGYCWDWITKKANQDKFDIEIGNFKAKWNLANTQTWAIDPQSIKEVGCIHTCQGLEFDYIGVIIGNDLWVDDSGILHTDFKQRAKTDKSIWGLKSMSKSNPTKAYALADKIIKNTYRVLMTRGMKGCYIYCTDKNLANYFKKKLVSSKS